jgi:hypothetical protein
MNTVELDALTIIDGEPRPSLQTVVEPPIADMGRDDRFELHRRSLDQPNKITLGSIGIQILYLIIAGIVILCLIIAGIALYDIIVCRMGGRGMSSSRSTQSSSYSSPNHSNSYSQPSYSAPYAVSSPPVASTPTYNSLVIISPERQLQSRHGGNINYSSGGNTSIGRSSRWESVEVTSNSGSSNATLFRSESNSNSRSENFTAITYSSPTESGYAYRYSSRGK